MQSLRIWLHSTDCVRLLSLKNRLSCSYAFFRCWTEILLHFLLPFTDSSLVPPLIYSLMGSSRDIAIGPVAVVSLLLGTLLQNEIDPVANPEDYRRLAFTATFFAGITQAILGVCRYEWHFDSRGVCIWIFIADSSVYALPCTRATKF